MSGWTLSPSWDWPTDHYKKRDGNRMTYTIVRQQVVGEMQQNLMGWKNNASVSWLTSQKLYSSWWKLLSVESFRWIPTETLKSLILTLVSSSSSLGSGCWWQQTLAQTGRSILAKTLYIYSVRAEFVSTLLCLEIIFKFSALVSSLTPPH